MTDTKSNFVMVLYLLFPFLFFLTIPLVSIYFTSCLCFLVLFVFPFIIYSSIPVFLCYLPLLSFLLSSRAALVFLHSLDYLLHPYCFRLCLANHLPLLCWSVFLLSVVKSSLFLCMSPEFPCVLFPSFWAWTSVDYWILYLVALWTCYHLFSINIINCTCSVSVSCVWVQIPCVVLWLHFAKVTNL